MSNHFLQLIFGSFFLVQCITTKHSLEEPALIIQLEKTGCRGYCPVYKLSIFSDHTVLFTGIAHTEVKEAKMTLTGEDYEALIDAFEQKEFKRLDSAYIEPVVDIPFTYLSFKENNEVKKVAARGSAPDNFWILTRLTEQVALDHQWLKKDPIPTETLREVIIELKPDADTESLASQYEKYELTLIKKITPNQSYFLFSVVTDDPDAFLVLLRENKSVKAAQWNHKLKKRSN